MLKYPKSLGSTIVTAIHKSKFREEIKSNFSKKIQRKVLSPESSLPFLRLNEKKHSVKEVFHDN